MLGTYISQSEHETKELGAKLLDEFKTSGIVALVGDLGAGKTHLVKGLAEAAGFSGDVTSPTFSLVHEYQAPEIQICHFDFYRLESESELWDLGWEDYLDRDAVLAVAGSPLFRASSETPKPIHFLKDLVEISQKIYGFTGLP